LFSKIERYLANWKSDAIRVGIRGVADITRIFLSTGECGFLSVISTAAGVSHSGFRNESVKCFLLLNNRVPEKAKLCVVWPESRCAGGVAWAGSVAVEGAVSVGIS
jgi:hypothetical protein